MQVPPFWHLFLQVENGMEHRSPVKLGGQLHYNNSYQHKNIIKKSKVQETKEVFTKNTFRGAGDPSGTFAIRS